MYEVGTGDVSVVRKVDVMGCLGLLPALCAVWSSFASLHTLHDGMVMMMTCRVLRLLPVHYDAA